MNTTEAIEMIERLDQANKKAVSEGYAAPEAHNNTILGCFNDLHKGVSRLIEEIIAGDYDESTLTDHAFSLSMRVSELAKAIGLPSTYHVKSDAPPV